MIGVLGIERTGAERQRAALIGRGPIVVVRIIQCPSAGTLFNQRGGRHKTAVVERPIEHARARAAQHERAIAEVRCHRAIEGQLAAGHGNFGSVRPADQGDIAFDDIGAAQTVDGQQPPTGSDAGRDAAAAGLEGNVGGNVQIALQLQLRANELTPACGTDPLPRPKLFCRLR